MKKNFSLTLLACFYVLSLLCSPALAEDGWGDTTGTIKIQVPSKTPHINVLGVEFVLVEHIALPSGVTIMRDRWRSIRENHNQDLFNPKVMPLKGQHKGQWQALVKITKNSSDQLKMLRNVNGFFNALTSRNDQDFYGTTEHWASPSEFISNRSGDCEDYAITKYYALKYMGWKREDLWLVFLKEKVRDTGHAVLVAKSKKGHFVLDNLSKPRHLLIPAKQYEPTVVPFALANHQGLWLRVQGHNKGKNTATTRQ